MEDTIHYILEGAKPSKDRAATQLLQNSPGRCSIAVRGRGGGLSSGDEQKAREEVESSAVDNKILIVFILLQAARAMLSDWNDISNL